MHAWQVYIEEFRRRAERAEQLTIGRDEAMVKVAHDAYQAASDRLTRDHGWADEHALVVMRGLNGTVREWLDSGSSDWQSLSSELRRTEEELDRGWQG